VITRTKALIVVATIAVAGAALAVALARLNSDEAADELDEAYALMTRAMSRPGMVLHTVSTARGDADSSCVSTMGAWVSEGGEKVRIISGYRCSGVLQESREMLSVRGTSYFVDIEGSPQREASAGCRGTDLPGLLFFLACNADRNVSVSARSSVNFEGRDVVRIRSAGDLQGIDSNVTTDSSLYVDLDTGLPIATRSVLTDDYGGTTTSSDSLVTYEHEYMERTLLPVDFFEPEGIGFKDPGVR
jgi:hypothetical protein